MHSTHSVGQAASGGSENLQAAPPPLQHGQHAGQGGSTGAVPIAAPAAPQPDWFDRVLQQAAQPHSDKSALVTITQSFINAIEQQAQQVQAEAFKLSGPISQHEWDHARSTQPAVIDKWFYEDVGVFVAPGGTGKTTLLLFQVIHLVLGLELFGYEVINPGTVIILTAEDSRETLVARLRYMCAQLQLSPADVRKVQEGVIITDVSGKGIKLAAIESDVVVPSKFLDRFIVDASEVHPSLIIIDPMVSFGVGESRINDSEQAMIDAARRIRNMLRCAVLYVHHTGKANARDKTLDQYSGRGGSALADGARMVHVLQRLDPEAWTEQTGDTLEGEESGFVLARPKMTWCPPQPNIYLKRQHYLFERFYPVESTEGAGLVIDRDADKVFQFVKDEYLKGKKHSQNTLIQSKLLSQARVRAAVERLKADNRLIDEKITTGGQGGARSFLRPMELPQ